jgi:hypothetical protein
MCWKLSLLRTWENTAIVSADSLSRRRIGTTIYAGATMTKRRHATGWLFYLAAWGVSSIMVGALLGQRLKQDAEDELLPEPARTHRASQRPPDAS